MTRETMFVGIDFGATLIKVGIVNRAGTILSSCQIPTSEANHAPEFRVRAAEAIARLCNQHDLETSAIQGIGLGAPGWVDSDRGVILRLTNLPHWREVPITKSLSEETGLRVIAARDGMSFHLADLD